MSKHYNRFYRYQTLWLTKSLIVGFFAVILSGCQSIGPAFQTPTVELLDVRPAGQQGLQQLFDVQVKLGNPNPYALSLVGIDYRIELASFDVITGNIADVQSIPSGGEQILNVGLAIGILEGLQLLNSLRSSGSSGLDYRVLLNLDTGIPLIGSVPVTKSGTIDASSFGSGF